MPTFTRGDAEIHYEVHGDGPAVLALAPGGMRSAVSYWPKMPWDPMARLADGYKVVAMDQRNAGSSRAPVRPTDGWAEYRDDQLGLMDHLGIDRFHVVGMCIGGSFIAELARHAGERMASGVMLQPIGLDGDHQIFFDMFDGWADEAKADHPEASDEDFAAFRRNLFGGDDFLFSQGEEFIARCPVPLLVMMGNDPYHPEATSRRVAKLAPDAMLVERWKEPEHIERAAVMIRQFLDAHS